MKKTSQNKSKNKLIRQLATWIVTFIMMSVFILDIATVALCNKYEKNYDITDEKFDFAFGNDRIHFLNTGNSDAILIESNGHFALVDSGEGNNNPRRKGEAKGYRDEVTAYIKKCAGDENGKVTLDFILATHYHYDHAGNFEAIILDKDITIKKAYFKEYNDLVTTELEKTDWGNKATYEAIIGALKSRNVNIISELPDSEFMFGDFAVRFINTVTPDELSGKGDNSDSVGVLLRKSGKSAFLAADFTKESGLEELYADDIGDIDLLKIGHHGYFGSSSQKFLKKLKPEIAICTNYLGKIYPNVKWNLTMVAHVPIYSCVNRDGIIATFANNGEIIITEHAMRAKNQ